MGDMNPQMCALLGRVRDADNPPPQARERVRQQVAATLAKSGAIALGVVAAAASSSVVRATAGVSAVGTSAAGVSAAGTSAAVLAGGPSTGASACAATALAGSKVSALALAANVVGAVLLGGTLGVGVALSTAPRAGVQIAAPASTPSHGLARRGSTSGGALISTGGGELPTAFPSPPTPSRATESSGSSELLEPTRRPSAGTTVLNAAALSTAHPSPLRGSFSSDPGTVNAAEPPMPRAGEPSMPRAGEPSIPPAAELSMLPAAEPPMRRPLGSASPTITSETRLLAQAQLELRSGHAQRSLELIEVHETDHPDGTLREERMATKILVLCSLSRTEDAKAEARRFESHFPLSPLLERVQRSCVKRSAD